MNPKRIHLTSGSGAPVREELAAAGTITPGHLCSRTAANAVVVHPSAAGPAEKLFAVEDSLQGNTIADNYSSGDQVALVVAQPGDKVYAWLAAGESVTPADFLTSNGDGTLKEGSTTNYRVAVPLETVDNSDTGAVAVRIRVQIV